MKITSFPPLVKWFLTIIFSRVYGNTKHLISANLLSIHHLKGYFSCFFFEANLSTIKSRTSVENLYASDFSKLFKQFVQIVFSETKWKIIHPKSHITHNMASVYFFLASGLYRHFGYFLFVKSYHSFAFELIFFHFEGDLKNLAILGKEFVDLTSGCF